MSRRRFFPSAIVALVIALTCTAASAEQEADRWQQSRSLEPLYERIAADLEQGKPLIIAGYYGMWHTRSDQPDRNLHWGAVGYFGHNFFYDYANFEWDGLDRIEGEVERPTGVFAVGCKTGTVPGFGKLLTRNAFAVLFSRSLMATEGYSTLALADGLTRALDSKEMVGLADRTYRYFQKLAKPDRRVGSPFVSHGYRLFD